MIELSFLKKDAKVLENGRETTGRSRRLLKRLDDLDSAKDALWDVLIKTVKLQNLSDSPWES